MGRFEQQRADAVRDAVDAPVVGRDSLHAVRDGCGVARVDDGERGVEFGGESLQRIGVAPGENGNGIFGQRTGESGTDAAMGTENQVDGAGHGCVLSFWASVVETCSKTAASWRRFSCERRRSEP